MNERKAKDARVAGLVALLLQHVTLAAASALVAALLFALLADAVSDQLTRSVDDRVLLFFQAHRSAYLDLIMTVASLLASTGVVIGASVVSLAIAWRDTRLRAFAASVVIATIGGEGLIQLLKALFHRARPHGIFAHLGYSFPSGHAFFAVVLYGLLALWLTHNSRDTQRRITAWIGAVALTLIIGLSRIYLGVHYLSDVIGGFVLAIPWVWGCLVLPKILFRIEDESESQRSVSR